MRRLPSAVIAAGSLIAGFGVAELTGQRWLGGIVLVAGVAVCWPMWRRSAGLGAAVGLSAGYLVAFVLSHVIAGALGAWVSVFLVSALVAAACWVVADRPHVSTTARPRGPAV